MYSRACQRVHEIDPVADLGISGYGADLRIGEVLHQPSDGIVRDDAVGVDADVDLFVGLIRARS